MKRQLIALLLSVSFLSTGCVAKLDEKLQTMRETKYDADKAFAGSMRILVRLADNGWQKKHALQKLIFDNVYADRIRGNTVGFEQDEKGVPIRGNIPIAIMWKIDQTYRAEQEKYKESIAQWEKAKQVAINAIDAYEKASEVTYALESDALEAKKSAQAQLTAALEALGVLAGAAVGAAIAAG